MRIVNGFTLKSIASLKLRTPNLPELNAQPVLVSPYHKAMPGHLIAVHSEVELVRNGHCIWNVYGSPDF